MTLTNSVIVMYET